MSKGRTAGERWEAAAEGRGCRAGHRRQAAPALEARPSLLARGCAVQEVCSRLQAPAAASCTATPDAMRRASGGGRAAAMPRPDGGDRDATSPRRGRPLFLPVRSPPPRRTSFPSSPPSSHVTCPPDPVAPSSTLAPRLFPHPSASTAAGAARAPHLCPRWHRRRRRGVRGWQAACQPLTGRAPGTGARQSWLPRRRRRRGVALPSRCTSRCAVFQLPGCAARHPPRRLLVLPVGAHAPPQGPPSHPAPTPTNSPRPRPQLVACCLYRTTQSPVRQCSATTGKATPSAADAAPDTSLPASQLGGCCGGPLGE